jgi:pimeloyl-ACP methyl ester carboxylesterase
MRPVTTPQVESGRVEIDGARLEWRWCGPRPGLAPTLVFLHEGLGSTAQWRDFPERLAADAGYGRSSPIESPRPVSFMHAEATRTLPQVLARFGVDQPVLFGHSDGASIALIYAGSHCAPAPLALILEAAHVTVEPICLQSIRRLEATVGDPVAGAGLRERFARHHDRAEETMHAWIDVWLRPEFAAWDIRALLPAVACPVLGIQGKEDAYGTPAQLDLLRAGVAARVETHLLAACGHAPHRDRREEVLALSKTFLASVTG